MTLQISHTWEPIQDLPIEHAVLAQPELRALSEIWLDSRD
jgi:hypothetical protein